MDEPYIIRQRILGTEKVLGTFLNTGSAIAAEIAGRSGLDWCVVDFEHGMNDWGLILQQLMAIEGTGMAAFVRAPLIDAGIFKRALDFGAHGLMVPMVETAEDAAEAVSLMRYPPHGRRGVASNNRGAHYGAKMPDRLARAHTYTTFLAQIETARGLDNVEAIAAVDGVDVLFVGPTDLSVNLGCPGQMDHPDYLAAIGRIVAAARTHGKATGILLRSTDQIAPHFEMGFTVIASGSDGGAMAAAFADVVATGSAARNG